MKKKQRSELVRMFTCIAYGVLISQLSVLWATMVEAGMIDVFLACMLTTFSVVAVAMRLSLGHALTNLRESRKCFLEIKEMLDSIKERV